MMDPEKFEDGPLAKPDIIEDEFDSSRAPLLDHLIELRSRLIKVIIGMFIAFAVALYFWGNIFDILEYFEISINFGSLSTVINVESASIPSIIQDSDKPTPVPNSKKCDFGFEEINVFNSVPTKRSEGIVKLISFDFTSIL